MGTATAEKSPPKASPPSTGITTKPPRDDRWKAYLGVSIVLASMGSFQQIALFLVTQFSALDEVWTNVLSHPVLSTFSVVVQAATFAWAAACAVTLPSHHKTTWLIVGITLAIHQLGYRALPTPLSMAPHGHSKSDPAINNMALKLESDDPSTSSPTVVLDVQGMTCGGCGARVQSIVQAWPGVQEATVDWRAGIVTMVTTTDASGASGDSLEGLVAQLTAKGYPAEQRPVQSSVAE